LEVDRTEELSRLRKKARFVPRSRKSVPGLNRLRKKALIGAECRFQLEQGLKPSVDLIDFIGTTEVMPCYKTRFDGAFPQPVKSTHFIRFIGTTEVVP
jgi:hypothetical protein